MNTKLFILFFNIFSIAVAREYSSVTGYGHSVENPLLGIAHSVQGRFTKPRYVDGLSQMYAPPLVPGARDISNQIHGVIPLDALSSTGLSEMSTLFGQFFTHDLGWTPASNTSVSGGINITLVQMCPIPVPICDPQYDIFCWGNRSINAARAVHNQNGPADQPRQFINEINSWIDGSTIYGNDEDRTAFLRTYVGGKLKTSPGYGGDFLPLNTAAFPNSNDAKRFANNLLYLCGDQRCNENAELTAMHTLWVREHNRVAKALGHKHQNWTDEIIFQEARRWVVAELQSISMNEYIPGLTGQRLPAYMGYDSSLTVNETFVIGLEFQGVALRVGHSQVDNQLLRLNEKRQTVVNGTILLRDLYTNPPVLNLGIDPILRGLAYQLTQEVDPFIVNDLRNLMFGPPGGLGQDMAALDIQRGRDIGIPDYNSLRVLYGLPAYTDFAQITSNENIQDALRRVYLGNISNIDAITGALCEDHEGNAAMGPLFVTMMMMQMQRVRDMDRFWYENTSMFSEKEITTLNELRLADIILLNTNIGWIQRDVFHAHSTPPPVKNFLPDSE